MKRILCLIMVLGLLLMVTVVTLADMPGKIYLDVNGVIIGGEDVLDSYYLSAEYGLINVTGMLNCDSNYSFYNLKGGYLFINNSALKFGATLSYMNFAVDYFGCFSDTCLDTSGLLGGVICFLQTGKKSSLEGFYDFPFLMSNPGDSQLFYTRLKFNYAFTNHFGASVGFYDITCQSYGDILHYNNFALCINYLF